MGLPLIAIVGTTATGKSELAIKLAERHNGEIVSADSWLVRKYLDIGTAKPTKDMQRTVPHHLIDIIEPDEDYSAAEYKKQAQKVIEDILSRGKLPILVGGTGLYVDAVLYNYSFLNKSDKATRDGLNSMSLSELHHLAELKGLDTTQIDARNKRRVIRLIEAEGALPSKGELRANTLVIGLRAKSEDMRSAIKKRVDTMFELGLIKEVERMKNKYGWDCEGLKGIGYSEWRLYFEGNQSLLETKERIIKDTMALARRQQTWFKRNKSIHWFTSPVNIDNVDTFITTNLNKFMSD